MGLTIFFLLTSSTGFADDVPLLQIPALITSQEVIPEAIPSAGEAGINTFWCNPAHLAYGDFAGDGKIDLICNSPDGRHMVVVSKGDGSFSGGTWWPGPSDKGNVPDIMPTITSVVLYCNAAAGETCNRGQQSRN